VLPNFI